MMRLGGSEVDLTRVGDLHARDHLLSFSTSRIRGETAFPRSR